MAPGEKSIQVVVGVRKRQWIAEAVARLPRPILEPLVDCWELHARQLRELHARILA